tara:strand:+ start:332 stop:715 length:384 start_codon:yes stop_codon:yes gene_type:complete
MGNVQSIEKINFEKVQENVSQNDVIIINTLDLNDQSCLIYNTLNGSEEESTLNNMIRNFKKKTKIIIYGKNYFDLSVYKKYTQLKSLGFINICVYPGGMFEWLCLQEIYGNDLFKTTSVEQDILKYK